MGHFLDNGDYEPNTVDSIRRACSEPGWDGYDAKPIPETILARAEIAYRDDEMSVIMHGDDTRELWMFVNKGDERYSATYYAKHDRISLGMAPLEFTARYMELVKEYFLPYVRLYREKK